MLHSYYGVSVRVDVTSTLTEEHIIDVIAGLLNVHVATIESNVYFGDMFGLADISEATADQGV